MLSCNLIRTTTATTTASPNQLTGGHSARMDLDRGSGGEGGVRDKLQNENDICMYVGLFVLNEQKQQLTRRMSRKLV